LIGQTFHKLERYRESHPPDVSKLDQNLITKMPVCTRLVLAVARLATFKLPQVCELSVLFNGSTPNVIWERFIAANANLSGLKLLHVREWISFLERLDVVKILRSLPTLETLIISVSYDSAVATDFLRKFASMGTQKISTLDWLSRNNQISGVFCPRLESLQIEGVDRTGHSVLTPVLKEIVIMRAVAGSPLKSFTIYNPSPKRKFELIGRCGVFTVKEVVPAKRFNLQI
jgi:hypothetical protein